MMVRLGVQPSALTTLDDNAMRVVMGDIDHQRRLAATAPIGFVAAAFANRRSGRVFQNFSARSVFRRRADHIKLGHVKWLSWRQA